MCGTAYLQSAGHVCPLGGSTEKSDDGLEGAVIDDRYRIDKMLSKGGMGMVYQATHTVLDKPLAFKVMLQPQDEAARQRFLLEAKLAVQVRHRNIVDVVDFGVLSTNQPFLVMEFLVGQTLAELIERARHHDRRARSMLCERLLPFFHRVVAKLSFRFGRVTSETIRQESLDMVQYVACALLEDLDLPGGVLARWRPEQGPLEAWLRPFVTCRALDCLRKRKRPLAELGFGEHLPQALEQDLLSLHRALPGAMVQIEQRDALAKLCERILTEPHLGKEALTLLERLFWLEEDREDVAKSMGLKRNTLDVRVKRIREHLGRLCDELGIPFGQT